MTDDEFDALVESMTEAIQPHLEGKPWEAAIWSLAELMMGSVTDQDELEFVQEVLDEIGMENRWVTLQ